MYQIFLIALVAVVLLHPITTAFSTSRPLVVKQGLVVFPTVRFSSNADENDAAEAPHVENTTPPPRPQQPKQQPVVRLDPLVASLTRMDDDTKRAKTIKTPLFEIPVDGSLVVLLPAVLIGVVGLVMSIIVGIQSQDAILQEFNKLGNDQDQVTVQQEVDDGSCRGLCGSEDDFVGKKFMESLKK